MDDNAIEVSLADKHEPTSLLHVSARHVQNSKLAAKRMTSNESALILAFGNRLRAGSRHANKSKSVLLRVKSRLYKQQRP